MNRSIKPGQYNRGRRQTRIIQYRDGDDKDMDKSDTATAAPLSALKGMFSPKKKKHHPQQHSLPSNTTNNTVMDKKWNLSKKNRLMAKDNHARPDIYQSPIEETFPSRFSYGTPDFWNVFAQACDASTRWIEYKNLLLSLAPLPQWINGFDNTGETMMTLCAKHGRVITMEIVMWMKGNFVSPNAKVCDP